LCADGTKRPGRVPRAHHPSREATGRAIAGRRVENTLRSAPRKTRRNKNKTQRGSAADRRRGRQGGGWAQTDGRSPAAAAAAAARGGRRIRSDPIRRRGGEEEETGGRDGNKLEEWSLVSDPTRPQRTPSWAARRPIYRTPRAGAARAPGEPAVGSDLVGSGGGKGRRRVRGTPLLGGLGGGQRPGPTKLSPRPGVVFYWVAGRWARGPGSRVVRPRPCSLTAAAGPTARLGSESAWQQIQIG